MVLLILLKMNGYLNLSIELNSVKISQIYII